MFLSLADARAQLVSSYGWLGGLNETQLGEAEQRSYGWFHYMKSN